MTDRETSVDSEASGPADATSPADAPPRGSAPSGAQRPSVAPRAHGWRDQLVATGLSSAAIGAWLVVSPVVLGYQDGDTVWNPVVSGVVVVVLSAGRVVGPWRTRAIGLILFAVGAWLALSAFLFEAPPAGQWNQASFGAAVALLALVGLAGAQRGRELAGD